MTSHGIPSSHKNTASGKAFLTSKKTVHLAPIAFISGSYQKAADAQLNIIPGPVYTVYDGLKHSPSRPPRARF
jgi:hypothetical protein